MSVLDAARAAYAAGFRGQSLVTAIAIAGAESGYNPTSHNTKPPDDSVGLWQINYYGNLRPGRTATYGPPEALLDPTANARAAYAISSGGNNFGAWTTYTSGAYRSHLSEAAAAAAQVSGGSSSGGLDIPNPLGAVGDIAGSIPNPFDVAGAVGSVLGAPLSLASDIGKDLIQGLTRLSVFGVLLATGGALVVLGGWRAVTQSQSFRDAQAAAGPALTAAAMA